MLRCSGCIDKLDGIHATGRMTEGYLQLILHRIRPDCERFLAALEFFYIYSHGGLRIVFVRGILPEADIINGNAVKFIRGSHFSGEFI